MGCTSHGILFAGLPLQVCAQVGLVGGLSVYFSGKLAMGSLLYSRTPLQGAHHTPAPKIGREILKEEIPLPAGIPEHQFVSVVLY
jgi:hypothetical protein